MGFAEGESYARMEKGLSNAFFWNSHFVFRDEEKDCLCDDELELCSTKEVDLLFMEEP